MAARRLIIVLLVLFAVSIAAAALAPEQRVSPDSEDSTTTEATKEPEQQSAGEAISARIDAAAEEPETIRAAAGDQLALIVSSERLLEVAIDPYGLLEAADELAPARFNILLREPGSIPITDAAGGELIGRIEVAPQGAGDDGAEGEKPGVEDQPSDDDEPGTADGDSPARERVEDAFNRAPAERQAADQAANELQAQLIRSRAPGRLE